MKATGAPSYSGHAYPFPDIHDNLHRLYDAFGPTRFFWDTDITRMPCPRIDRSARRAGAVPEERADHRELGLCTAPLTART